MAHESYVPRAVGTIAAGLRGVGSARELAAGGQDATSGEPERAIAAIAFGLRSRDDRCWQPNGDAEWSAVEWAPGCRIEAAALPWKYL